MSKNESGLFNDETDATLIQLSAVTHLCDCKLDVCSRVGESHESRCCSQLRVGSTSPHADLSSGLLNICSCHLDTVSRMRACFVFGSFKKIVFSPYVICFFFSWFCFWFFSIFFFSLSLSFTLSRFYALCLVGLVFALVWHVVLCFSAFVVCSISCLRIPLLLSLSGPICSFSGWQSAIPSFFPR